MDVLTLAEVAAQARADGDIDPEETEAVFDSIGELRQEAEAVTTGGFIATGVPIPYFHVHKYS